MIRVLSSSAPVASKDEQAELIRKQKAKLERHFRRSTQVYKILIIIQD